MAAAQPTSGLGRFVAELRRRHVVRVSIAYGAVGFVLLQMAEIVLPAFLPGFEAEAALRIVVVAFLALLPVVVALAWVYEITPQGVRAMAELDAEAGHTPGGHLVPRVAFLVFTVLAAGSATAWWYRTDVAAQEELNARRATRQAPSAPFVSASTSDASGPIRSLAVLPLDDFSPEGDPEAYFAAGMHEAIISQLSQLGTVRVISRTSTEEYRHDGKSIPQIGQELGVDAVVEGSVVRADGQVRITVQLVHAASDTHLWARDYERDFSSIIALQREVAMAIAAEIENHLQGVTGARVAEAPSTEAALGEASLDATSAGAPAPPDPPEIYDAVMRGRFALNLATDEGAASAAQYFEEALALDSVFVPALTGLAGTRLVQSLDARGPEGLQGLLDARELAVRATRLDQESVEAREVLATTEEALAEYGARMAHFASDMRGETQIHRLGDDSVMIVVEGDSATYSRRDAPMASTTEIGRFIQVALAHDSVGERTSTGELRSIWRLEIGGRHAEALARAEEALERFPDEAALWDVVEHLNVSRGDLDRVVELRRDREVALGVGAGPGAATLSGRVAREGDDGYWRWKLDELDAREAGGERVSPVERAAALASLGRPDEALDRLDEALAARDPRLISLRTDPVWDSLRPESRFKALLRTLSSRSRTPRPPAGR